MLERKLLVLSTLGIILVSLIVMKIPERTTPFSINVENQFTYGRADAPIHMILFTEFACPRCLMFHKEELSIIDKKYVEKGKVRVTIIPLAFLEESLPACTLSLCIQKEEPSHMKSFYDFLFHLPQETLTSSSVRALLGLYQNLPSAQILQSLRNHSFANEIEHNISLAHQIYSEDVSVPIVLINGNLIPNTQSIIKVIDETL